jgi:hypothetical protein
MEHGMANAGEIHRCRIIDTFKLEHGRITRDAETEQWHELLEPIVVNVNSGVVKMGAAGRPLRWGILQRGVSGWDFVAERTEPGDTVLSTLRMRLWETPIQMVLIVNGFTFATGICEVLSGRDAAVSVLDR